MISSPTTDATGDFDKLSFVRYMKNVGRAYRKQSMELVSICRTFSQAQEQTPDADAKLRSALEAVDEALGSAAQAGVRKKTFETKVDQTFKKAIEKLESYITECHPQGMDRGMVNEKMAAAKTRDITLSASSGFFRKLFSPKTNKQPKPTKDMVVEVKFLLLKSLCDPNPTIVKQALNSESNLAEVLWNFTRYKDKRRLTLKQNPHFYKFPDSPQYGGGFRLDPIDNFQHTQISVITDKPSRVFVKTPQRTWAFGNFWRVPYNNDNNSIIFKDVCGKLEGENIVHASISDSSDHLWNLATPSTTSSASDNGPFRDWREPIRRRLGSENLETEPNICITRTDVGPTDSSSPPPESSPAPPAGSGANDGSGNSINSQSSHIGARRQRHTRPPQSTITIMWRVSEMRVPRRPPGKKSA